MTKIHPSDNLIVADLIRQAFDELALLHGEMKPFDKVFDEDLLEAKYQQREMIYDEVKTLKAKEGKSVDNAKLQAFEDLLRNIDSDIEMLTVTRMVEYSKWKLQYMSVCDKIQVAENKIRSLMQLERNMNGSN